MKRSEVIEGVEGKARNSWFASEKFFAGRVGEWLKPADCKSAAPCGLRRFESFPVHQALVGGSSQEPQAENEAMFSRDLICGECAAQEKCAAK